MEYAGNVTHRVMNRKIAITTCKMAGGKLYGYSFGQSQFFPTTKE